MTAVPRTVAGGLGVAKGRDHYLYYNGHGDLAAEADASGNRTALHTYDPFGAPLDTQPADQTVHRFTGAFAKQYDTATSLILMGARPYDPALGRFLAVDPIDGGSLNNYDYAGQDPINGYDLNGTMASADSVTAGIVPTRDLIVAIALNAAAAGTIEYTEGPGRMSGVTGHVKAPHLPPAADCSGFATWVYYAAGMADPNGAGYNGTGYTGTLWSHGSGGGKGPKPGDLVFFGNPKSSSGHVAIYIGGGMVVSQGGPGEGPKIYSMSAEASYGGRGYTGYRSYF